MSPTSQDAVGVIRGRFQVPELHEGHRYLFDYVLERHPDVLVILSDPYIANSADSLSFAMQKMMIESAYPKNNLRIVECGRVPSSRMMRSLLLDQVIEREFPGRQAILYGSRESIVHQYDGCFATEETPTVYSGSGTAIRNAIEIVDSVDFRKGVIYAAVHRPAIGYPTVDVAVVSPNVGQVLLVGWKEDEGKLRFPGVFFQYGKDANFEAAGKRCVAKELPGINTSAMQLIASHPINDYRFKRSQDGVITLLMRATCPGGVPIAGEGVDHVEWVDTNKVPSVLVDVHQPLGALMRHRW